MTKKQTGDKVQKSTRAHDACQLETRESTLRNGIVLGGCLTVDLGRVAG